jgi:hypothetical protein
MRWEKGGKKKSMTGSSPGVFSFVGGVFTPFVAGGPKE